VVRREPYRLAADVWGIGFKTADQLARSLGIPHDSPQRVKAGLQFALSQAAEDGHCYLPETELVAKATGLLEVEGGLTSRCLEELIQEEGVVAEPLPNTPQSPIDQPAPMDRAIWLVPFHRAEVALAGGLLRLLDASVDRLASFQTVNWTVALDWLRQSTGVTLAPEQEAAVRLALTQRVAVLTGGPGCGKSYTVRAIVALARAKRAKILLAAPTGRAAKRLSELAGLEAATLHRLLQLRPGGDAAFDRDHPLDADLVVVDEASMLDVLLANKLIKAIPPERTSCLSATSTSSPASAPGRCSGICWPPSGCPGSGSPTCSARPSRAGWSPTPTASTPATTRSPMAWRTSSSSVRRTPTGSPTWSSRLWPTACPAASASTPDARCRCCARCIGGRPAPGY
jgi:exodeoxyribonuclease V alpha subunit